MANVYLRDFPEELRKRAKIRAVIENITLKEVFIKALTEYLEKKGG